MKNPHQTLRILAVAALLAVPACSTTSVNSVERDEPVAQRQYIADKRIITDKSLDKIVGIVAVNETHTPDGFLKIQVEVQSRKSSTRDFLYRFQWFDENGNVVNLSSGATFKPRQILGKQSLFLTGIAPHERAKDFRLELLESTR